VRRSRRRWLERYVFETAVAKSAPTVSAALDPPPPPSDSRTGGVVARYKEQEKQHLAPRPKVDMGEQPKGWFDARKPKKLEELEVDCFLEQYRHLLSSESWIQSM
jgi:hypothetical protein